MRKILIYLLLLSPAIAFAQLTPEQLIDLTITPTPEEYRAHFPNACHMYNSSADYYNNKPVPNVDYLPWETTTKITLSRNGKMEVVKISEIGDVWLSDQYGILMRKVEKKFYRVVVDGPICYYVEHGNGEVKKNTDGSLDFNKSSFSEKYFEYGSKTLTGELYTWSDKDLEKYLKEYGWLEQYKAEKIPREMKDSVWDVESRKINKKLKYLGMVNEKLATK